MPPATLSFMFAQQHATYETESVARVGHVDRRTQEGSSRLHALLYACHPRLVNGYLACERCNAFKGTDLSGIDPDTGQVERLFDPRTQVWADHFELRGALILGRTSTGRATVAVLGMNEDRRVLLRAEILTLGEF